MGVPTDPVTLTPQQLQELNQSLSRMRHEINNHLALIVAAVELLRLKPEIRDKMLETLGQQPQKITAEMTRFSAEFERTCGITR
jgi:hypothetical protein